MSNNLWDTINRVATEDDLDQIAELEALGYEECLPRSTLLHVMGFQTYIVNTLNDDVLGYVAFDRHRDHNDEEAITIHRIAVHPSSRRRGIGWRLMTFCVDVARGLDCNLQLITIPEREQLGSEFFLAAMSFKEINAAGCISLFLYQETSNG
tara:strand:+ start:18489 stop:18944 length:456 start_codon:yes stop_codon:yes gene_type:complete